MLNRLILTGRLTATPELKTTSNNVSVTSFTLACDRNYTPSGQEKKTDFVNCVAWRNTAEFISKYFQKGRLMTIEAELQSRTYENKEGNKVTVWEAIVSQAYFGGDKSDSKPTEKEGFTEVEEVLDDDLPF